VVSQKPAGGSRAPRQSAVALTVSKGGVRVAVPALVGQQEADALAALQTAGLQPTVVRVPSSQPSGIVIAQSPAAGQKVDRGASVRLNVARQARPAQAGTTTATTTTAPATTAAPPPPASGTVAVPSLAGKGLADALGSLERAGLRATLEYLPSQKPVGTVVGQNPAAGKRVPRGTRVQVNAAEGTNPGNPTQVPGVTGQDQAAAETALEDAGFRVVVIDRTTGGGAGGRVVEQQPGAGTTLAAGDIVAIYVRR
jgi:serine/threonine-protein kinase